MLAGNRERAVRIASHYWRYSNQSNTSRSCSHPAHIFFSNLVPPSSSAQKRFHKQKAKNCDYRSLISSCGALPANLSFTFTYETLPDFSPVLFFFCLADGWNGIG